MKLLLDVMLGKLATYLRMCGYDAAYALDRGIESDDEVASLARREGRTLLTRDAELAANVDGSVLLSATGIDGQLREARDAGLSLTLDRPRRCGRCNGRVSAVQDDEQRPPDVPGEEPVWRCDACGQYFWRGSHWDDVRERLDSL